MKYRYVLPLGYTFLVILFFASFLLGMAEGPNPFRYIYFLMFPACFVLAFLSASASESDLLSIGLCALAGLLQYFLFGCLIDAILRRYRNNQRSQ